MRVASDRWEVDLAINALPGSRYRKQSRLIWEPSIYYSGIHRYLKLIADVLIARYPRFRASRASRGGRCAMHDMVFERLIE